MSLISASLPASVIPEAQGLARIVFGLLLVRHGLEQVFGYPPALVDYPPFSLRGALKIITLPGGILVMLGLFTRPVSLTISMLYLGYWLVEPLPASLLSGQTLFGARGPSDPILLTGFFLMFLAASGPGAWNLDRLRHRSRVSQPDPKWAEYLPGCTPDRRGFFVHSPWSGQGAGAQSGRPLVASRARGGPRTGRRADAHGWTVYAAVGVRALWADGGRVFSEPRAQRLLGQLRRLQPAGRCPELLSVPLVLGGGARGLESGRRSASTFGGHGRGSRRGTGDAVE